MSQLDVRTGRILLAEPFMLDPNFKRSVVLVCDHGVDGSVGFIINKILDMQLNELIDDFPDIDARIYFGGPVQTNTIHFVHCKGDLLEDSRQVTHGIYWGGDFEKLKFLVDSKLINPRDIRFFVGYSGWSEGQLTEEMDSGSWLVGDMDSNYLFKSQPGKIWQRAMQNKGDAFSVIAQMPDAANWN